MYLCWNKAIIINSPQNPTGSVMTPDEIDGMVRIAEKYDIYLYSDEIYADMVFDKSMPYRSPAETEPCCKRVIVATGFSKTYAMPGWRIGMAIAPPDVIERMGLLLQTTSSCVSPFIQRGAMEALSGERHAVEHMMKTYKERRDILVDGLNQIQGISCKNPQGTFYVFPNITGTRQTSEQFAETMLSVAGVALLPGTNFGRCGQGYVRLCYAISEDKLHQGLNRINSALPG